MATVPKDEPQEEKEKAEFPFPLPAVSLELEDELGDDEAIAASSSKGDQAADLFKCNVCLKDLSLEKIPRHPDGTRMGACVHRR